MEIAYQIERLLQFAQKHGLVDELDTIYARNALLDLFGLEAPFAGECAQENLTYPTEILDALLDAGAEKGLFDGEVNQFRVNFEARIMGLLMPRESECCRIFEQLRAQQDPKTIALERLQPKAGYPTCMLCRENIGYAGRINFPARQNHRIIPVTLSGDQFYLQYSPYVYFNEHCIVFHKDHKPLEMDSHTLDQIFSFVQQFPHYTCGSNANLPIVGGSILTHAHFQGGSYVFPMTRASIKRSVQCAGHPDVQAGILNWPVSTVRLCGKNAAEVKAAACDVLQAWQTWNDESADIRAFSGDTPHNTVTPILHREEDGTYVLDVALRNNRTSEEYPDGIFHPHPQWHNIKKENIGLIEVMGLAILPSRLKQQSADICDILTGKAPNESRTEGSTLAVHADWIDQLITRYGTSLSPAEAAEAVQREIGLVFSHVLEDAGVFKQTSEGESAFMRFLNAAGFQ